MPWFKKRPVHIEAMKFTGNVEETPDLIDWILNQGGTARYHEFTPAYTSEDGSTGTTEVPEHVAIDTLEGTMRASVGDWIIRGVQGEFYPCRSDIFEQTYEAADAPT